MKKSIFIEKRILFPYMDSSFHHVALAKPKNIFYNPGTWAIISCFIMVFIMGLVKIYSPDLGFHLKSAEWMLDNHQFIYTDSFSYGSAGAKYFDLQWLYQLLIYTLYNINESVLIIVNAVLITFSIVLTLYRFLKDFRSENTSKNLVFFGLTTIFLVQPLTFEIRPHVLSWIYLNLILLFLESYKRGKVKALFVLPVIMVIWVNSHSLSILGLVSIGIYVVGSYLENRRVDKKLLLYFGISFAAFLINPYFFEGLLYPFTQFGIISGNSLLKSYIGEFQSPFSATEIKMLGSGYFSSPTLIIHLSAVLSIVAIVRFTMQRLFTNAILLTAFFILLYLANKNYGYFLMVSLPLLVQFLINFFVIKKKGEPVKKHTVSSKKRANEKVGGVTNIKEYSQKLPMRLSYVAITLAGFISITTITDGYAIFRKSPFRFGLDTDNDQLPVEATAFLNDNNIKGKLLNHLDFGGYLIANFSEKVFIDGRLEIIQPSFFETYYQSLRRRNGVKNLLDEYQPDIVIFPYIKASYWWDFFVSAGNKSGYNAVYFDGLSVIYLKNATFPHIAILKEDDFTRKAENTTTILNENLEKNKTNGIAILIKGLWQKQSFDIASQNRSSYCFANGFKNAGLYFAVTGLRKSTIHTPNIYKNLAVFYKDEKMYALAQACEEKADQ